MDELTEALRDLAKEIGCRTDELAPHVVNHVWLQALVCFMGGAVGVVALSAGILYYIYRLKQWVATPDKSRGGDVEAVIYLVGGLLAGVGFMVGFVLVAVTVEHIPTLLDPVGATVRIILGK